MNANKKTRRGLKNNLADLLVSNAQMNKHDEYNSLNIQGTFTKNISLYAVIRSKGGSGEKHIVKKLVNELLTNNKRVFICFEHPLDINDLYLTSFLPKPVNKIIQLNDMKYASGGVINLDWRVNNLVNKMLCSLENEDHCAIIFTVGTGSAGQLYNRVTRLSALCKTIFISVDSHVENSIEPTKHLCASKEDDLQNIRVCWWHKLASDNSKHLLGLFSSEEIELRTEANLTGQVINQYIDNADGEVKLLQS